MEEENNYENNSSEEEAQFEMSAEKATSLGGVQLFNRKKVLVFLCCTMALFVGGGLIINLMKPDNRNTAVAEREAVAGNTSAEFLTSLQHRAANNRRVQEQQTPQPAPQMPQPEAQPVLPPVSITTITPTAESFPPPPPQNRQAPPPATSSAPPAQAQPRPSHFSSSLVPQMAGSLFAQQLQMQNMPAHQNRNEFNHMPVSQATSRSADHMLQNDQMGRQAFFNPSGGGGVITGRFIGENAVWAGTIIPGILETAINTDLPGNILARVTQNIYDSQTGRRLLIPQGTLLLARYSSAVSYAQRRVQIVWETMIRPDGFHVELDGAGGVDRFGMSGQEARYHENWFEYLKAAGIITLFSIANARMTETAAAHATEASAANIAEANSLLVNQLGGNLVSRALNIQPTLTVDNGTIVNIMLNRTIYLPPVTGFPVTGRYILE
jgi:type IV secretory pathway VirB10-like protein